jgi:hypothetical protein
MSRPTRRGAGGHVGTRRGRCLDEELTAYADRDLDPPTLLHWDRHLVSCEACRGAVAREREVLSALRAPSAPDVPGNLRGMLLAMAGTADAPRTGARTELPPVPAAPVPAPPVAPLPVVHRAAPAFHRSARRSTVFAGLAAGATAAAAWGLVVSGGAASPAGVTPGPLPRTGPASVGRAPAVFTVPAARFVRATGAARPTTPPATGTGRPSSAQLAP